ncbi:BnaA07g24550D [Brassica napus]|uniref:BnaA07g24550D protein n=1 Tax=Brassica napus TaxID=3708 RepID=A0A078F1U4_BRANA|nr:BnaA07g24550D [Brassica napus]
MAWSSETPSYCGWNELNVKNAKGKTEVHYYLERRDGCADLAVVGRLRRASKGMSFRYALKMNRSVLKKLSSLEDVKGWLDSIVSGEIPHVADVRATTVTEQAAGDFNIDTFMNGKPQVLIHSTINFSWMGSSWTCRKRRKHYPSFSRNGVRVSVNDFVYVLAEQHKRLIAYLEDLYEDSKGNKMVVVRWFHKADEVGIDLTDDANDREIFFSHCLQDIKIECIDGLASVLSPQHYEELLKVPMHVQRVPFFCQKLYGDDGIEPYDITQLQGYWRQEVLRYLNVSILKTGEGAQPLDIDTDPVSGASLVDLEASDTSMCKGAEDDSSHLIKKGSVVEVLSQDSGIRGCWLVALVVKKHKDKVKVQYQDIMDADDESKKLEEWILASQVAASDHLGLRIPGRKVVRPNLRPSNESDVCAVDVGVPVDVWWCDGWWEGIVVEKVSEERVEVYLPGEKKISSFHRSGLRQSLEWLADEWVQMKPRSDLVSSVLASMKKNEVEVKPEEKLCEVGVGDCIMSLKDEAKLTVSLPVATTNKPVPDLLKHVLVSDLKWTASSVVGPRKRNRVVSFWPHDPSLTDGYSCENGKFMGDSVFGSSVGQHLAGLLMSR